VASTLLWKLKQGIKLFKLFPQRVGTKYTKQKLVNGSGKKSGESILPRLLDLHYVVN